jgi:hypothetical protein
MTSQLQVEIRPRLRLRLRLRLSLRLQLELELEFEPEVPLSRRPERRKEPKNMGRMLDSDALSPPTTVRREKVAKLRGRIRICGAMYHRAV